MDNRKRLIGFTLVELIISVAIFAILFLIAIPSYLGYLQKGRRADAVTSLLHLQLLQAQWRVDHGEYATLEELAWQAGKENSLDGFYSIVVVSRGPGGYRVVAKPVKGQLDDACGVFAINEVCTVYSGYAGPRCWGR